MLWTNIPFLLISSLMLDSSFACSPDQPKGKDVPSIKLSVELVVLDVEVLNQKTGQIIGNLKKQDFLLYEDGVRQEITHFSHEKMPLSILLLLDVSASVQPVIERIRDGALHSLDCLRPEDEVALMAFAKTAQLVQDFTKEKRVIVDKIEAIHQATGLSRKGTYLNEAVHQAASHLRAAANPTTRRVIITVTDNVSSQLTFVGHSEREALYELFESGGVLCALVPSEWIGAVLRNTKQLSLPGRFLFSGSVNNFAKETGGIVLKARREEIQTKLDGLIGRLRARYSLGYVSSNPKCDGQFRRLKLKISPGVEGREGKVMILSKRGYYASRAKSISF